MRFGDEGSRSIIGVFSKEKLYEFGIMFISRQLFCNSFYSMCILAFHHSENAKIIHILLGWIKTVNPLEYLEYLDTSEHLTREIWVRDTLSSERRFGFQSLVVKEGEKGAVLFTTYIRVLSQFSRTSSFFESDYNHSLHSPPPFSIVFTSGAIAGAAQSLVAAPLDSLKVRFEVNDLLEGKHKSMFDFANTTWKESGVASIYRGIGLNVGKEFWSRILDMFLDFRFGKLQ
ncbi:hypothetical protein C1646_668133 [Rhizophagus diaphanus]|nr:hypothetical protein C1646_668133 [Rhizophagus diaphanus] [Rhizophagus sp. MUCL 43196]